MYDIDAIRRLIDCRIAERGRREKSFALSPNQGESMTFYCEQTPICEPVAALCSPRTEIADFISGHVPSANSRQPDLHTANLSFAARVLLAVQEKFGGDAPRVYAAAGVSRQVYSQIVSDETKPVQKRTAVRLAFGLRSSPEEAALLLKSAGYAFSNAQTEDFILQACLEADPPCYDFETINALLREYGVDYQY